MSQICSTCGRGALTGNLRSKSMVATKTRQKVNLQSRKIQGQRVLVCTNCMRTMMKKPGTIKIQAVPKRLTHRRTKQKAVS